MDLLGRNVFDLRLGMHAIGHDARLRAGQAHRLEIQ